MLVPTSDAVGRCIYYTGDYDRKITWLCRHLLRTGDNALDIGANLGVVTMTMARAVGPTGKVHAFEPNPAMQSFIEASRERNGYSQVTLHKIGLGDTNTELDLFVPQSNFGMGSFVSAGRERSGIQTVRCPIDTLDDVVQRVGLTSIRLIKIDVEGFEESVFKGATNVLARTRPHAIIMETNEHSNCRFRDRGPVAILLKNGYRFLALPKALLTMRVDDVELDAQRAPSHDILAVAEERYSEIRAVI